MDKYKTLSIDEFLKYQIGTCWDYSEFEAWFFEKYFNYKMNYNKPLEENEFSLYYMEIKEDNNCPSHTWLAYKDKNKIKIFESSWKSNSGIKIFNSEKDMIESYLSQHKKANNLEDSDKIILCKYKPLLHKSNSNKKIHLNPNKYMENMYNIGTMIISNFKKLPIELPLEKLK